MISLSLKELEQKPKNDDIKDYKRLSLDKLLSKLDKTKQVQKTKTIKDIRKENFNSDKILRDIRILYEPEKDYYEPIKTINAFNNNCIEYESNGDKDKILSVKEYLNMIKQYLRDIINDHKTQDEWKIQLTMKINFIPSKDSKDSSKTHTMHTTSDNIEIIMGNETYEIIEELVESFLPK